MFKSKSNVIAICAAPWSVELPDGRLVHGFKREIKQLARRYGRRRIFDRTRQVWLSL